LTDQTLIGSSESILLAAQDPSTFPPINVTSTVITVVSEPTASQFDSDLESMRVAETLVGMIEGPSTAHKSYTLDTIPDTQDLNPEVVLTNISVGIGHLPYEEIVDPNATTLPMHYTPEVDSPDIGMQSVDTEYISPVFAVPPQTAASRDHPYHTKPILHTTVRRTEPLHCFPHQEFSTTGTSHDISPRERDTLYWFPHSQE